MGNPKILIACHCSGDKYHSRLFVRTDNSSVKPMEEFFGAGNVFYLDTAQECKGFERQFSSWDELPNDFFQIMYLQNCPIYPPIITPRNPDIQPMRTPDVMEVWENLFTKGIESLKKDGGIIIPIPSNLSPITSQYYAINLPVNKRKIGSFFRKGLVNLLRYMNISGWEVYLSDALPASPSKVFRQAMPLLFTTGANEYDQYLLLMRKQTGGKRKTRKVRRK